jgi:integrase/recombinase XerD
MTSSDSPYSADFFAYITAEKGLSTNTVVAYQQDLEQFFEFCRVHHVLPPDANLSFLRGYVGHMRKLGQSSRTLARKVSTLKQFYSFLMRENRVVGNPAELLTILVKEKRLPKHLTEAEMVALVTTPDGTSETSTRDRAILELWYATGCRVTELVQLESGQIDWKGRVVRVLGKGNRERLIPIHEEALFWCKRYKEVRHEWMRRWGLKDTDIFFLTLRGTTFTRQALWKLVRQYAKMAGITRPVWPHMIRHSFATQLLAGGADLRAVQELLGHRSITTTEVYTHLNIENLKVMQAKFHPRS